MRRPWKSCRQIGADVFLSIPLVNGTTIADIQNHDAFAEISDGNVTSQAFVSAIPNATTPEGASGPLLLSGLTGIAFFTWRRRRLDNPV